MNYVVDFDGVRKTFEGRLVLNNLTFKIQENSFTALVGNNGCGKSTTINILCNILGFDSGQVKVFDKPLSPQYVSYKQKLGIVLSKPVYVPSFSVKEYLKFVSKFQRINANEIDSRIKEIIYFLDIQNPNTEIKKLSLGNQMKVSLAAALIHNPTFLILDEPFVNLDIGTVETIITLLKNLQEKKTILITSHNLDLIAELCDTYLIMKQGAIIKEMKRSEYISLDAAKASIKELLENPVKKSELSWFKV